MRHTALGRMGPIAFSLALMLTLVFLAWKNIAPRQRTSVVTDLPSVSPATATAAHEGLRRSQPDRHVAPKMVVASSPSLKGTPKSRQPAAGASASIHTSQPPLRPSSPAAAVSTPPLPAQSDPSAAAQKPQAPSHTAPPPSAGTEGLPPGVTYASNTDPVRIVAISLSSDTVHGGELASAKVITTSNAASVTARIGTYVVSVPKTAPGIFTLSVTLPRVLIPGQTEVVVTAIRSDGASVQRSVPIRVLL